MVTVRLFAAARDAAGTTSVTVPAGTVAEISSRLGSSYGPALARVVGVSSILVAGRRVSADAQIAVADGTVIDVLPPFAGG